MNINLYLRFRLILIYLLILIVATGTHLFAQTTDSTFFRDDFNRTTLGSSWEQDGSWSIVNGSAYNFTGGPGGTLKTTTNFPQASYIIETAAMGFNVNYYRYFRITFGQADLLNDNQLYELTYTAWLGGRLTLSKATDNVFYPEVLDEVAIFPWFSSSTRYTFKIARYESGLIQVYVNDGAGYSKIPVLEAIDSTYLTLGHTGWQVDTDAFPEDFYVDWLSASKPGVVKPAIKEKPVEDSLIAQVSAKSGKNYKVDKLVPGAKHFIDRDYTITTVPRYLMGASFIQTANDDKLNKDDSFLTFFLKTSAIVYIGYDSRSTVIPKWLEEWTKTGDSIKTSDEKAGYLSVYSKLIQDFGKIYPFPDILGGNLANPALDANTNYLVAAIKRPALIKLQAEDALLSGAVVATNHPAYNGTGFVDFKNPENDYIEWTAQIDVPGVYDIGFRYANGSLKMRSLQITVNGIIIDTVNFYPGFSSSWSSWSYTSVQKKLFLSSGVNTVKVTAIGNSGPNLDELNLYYIAPSVLTANNIAPIASGKSYLLSTEVAGKLPAPAYKTYPNPFVQSTTIYYQVKTKARVILAIYTLQGQQLQLLENSVHSAGNYQSVFNAGKFSKGIYFYRLQIGNEVKTGKLIKE